MIIRKQLGQRHFLKSGDRDNLQNLVQAAGKSQSPFGNRHQEICAYGTPNLNADTVGMSGEKSAQPQVLLDPAEKQFDLPSLAVNGGDGQSGQLEVVREEHKGKIGIGVVKSN